MGNACPLRCCLPARTCFVNVRFVRTHTFCREPTPVAEVEANVPKEAMDINTAVRVMLKKAMQHDGLARGLHEAARAVEKGWVGATRKKKKSRHVCTPMQKHTGMT